MAVYVIQAGDDGPVKIGVAKDVQKRLAGMQVSNPAKLSVRAEYVGAVPEEAALHDRFASHRLRGEWFDAAVLAHDFLLPVVPPKPAQVKVALPHAAIIAALGGYVEIAKRLGVSRTTPHNWRRTGIPARFWLDVMKAAEAAGKPVSIEAVRWRPAKPAVVG